jgi:hypothetical protein
MMCAVQFGKENDRMLFLTAGMVQIDVSPFWSRNIVHHHGTLDREMLFLDA